MIKLNPLINPPGFASCFYYYSKLSMTRTPMARLPWIIRTWFLSPYEILPIAQENKYSGRFSFLIMKLYVVCTY